MLPIRLFCGIIQPWKTLTLLPPPPVRSPLKMLSLNLSLVRSPIFRIGRTGEPPVSKPTWASRSSTTLTDYRRVRLNPPTSTLTAPLRGSNFLTTTPAVRSYLAFSESQLCGTFLWNIKKRLKKDCFASSLWYNVCMMKIEVNQWYT
jgi:hypothetical protein